MKLKQLIVTGLICQFLMSCSPQINYLGNNYPQTMDIEVFFDEKDVQREYKVMGVMKNEGSEWELDNAEDVKNEMIKKAQFVGADAILFIAFYSEKTNSESSDIQEKEKGSEVTTTSNTTKIYEAKVLKYL